MDAWCLEALNTRNSYPVIVQEKRQGKALLESENFYDAKPALDAAIFSISKLSKYAIV